MTVYESDSVGFAAFGNVLKVPLEVKYTSATLQFLWQSSQTDEKNNIFVQLDSFSKLPVVFDGTSKLDETFRGRR